MAVFEIQGADGKTYEVEAPTIEEAAAAVRSVAESDKSFGRVLWENIAGDNDPTTQNVGEKVGTFLNKAGESMTFGLVGDEAIAALESKVLGADYGERRDFYRDQERQLEESNPGAALTADVGGALVGALLPGGAIGTMGRGAGLLPRVGASAAAGAGMGGTYGFMEGEGGASERGRKALTGAAIGGAAGAVIPAVGAGVQRVADSRAANRAIREAVEGAPSSAALRAEGSAAYRAIDDAGVRVRPDRVRSAMDEISEYLRNEGAGYTGADRVMPASRSVMDAAGDVGAGANTVPFEELDMFRRYIGNAAGSNPANASDTRAVTGALTGLDDFVRNLTPDDVDAGDIETLKTMLPKARDLWARMSRSQLLDDAIEAGNNNYRTGSASGVRAKFQRILNNPRLRKGFSDPEIAMIRRVVNGTMPEQIINLMGSGGGLMAQGAVGAALGGWPGMLAGGAVGVASRKAAERMVNRNAEIARALVASGKAVALPVASDNARAVTEALMRRTAAAGPQ